MNDIVAIMRAADFAARKHTSQKRKGEEAAPYLNHLIEVASLVADAIDGRPDVVIAALLHDAVEDQDVTNAEIADLFGPTVASLVAEVTDDKSLPKQVRKDEQIAGASHIALFATKSSLTRHIEERIPNSRFRQSLRHPGSLQGERLRHIARAARSCGLVVAWDSASMFLFKSLPLL